MKHTWKFDYVSFANSLLTRANFKGYGESLMSDVMFNVISDGVIWKLLNRVADGIGAVDLPNYFDSAALRSGQVVVDVDYLHDVDDNINRFISGVDAALAALSQDDSMDVIIADIKLQYNNTVTDLSRHVIDGTLQYL